MALISHIVHKCCRVLGTTDEDQITFANGAIPIDIIIIDG